MDAKTATTLYQGFLMTLDPLHIGSGGYRLSRVDLPILREPATNLPKIPGSSLNGAARSNAALKLRGRDWKDAKGEFHQGIRCAGQRDHCGKCAVCRTFGCMTQPGRSEKNEDFTWSGMVSFFDAQVALFPVASMLGPLWITSRDVLTDSGFTKVPDEPSGDRVLLTRANDGGRVNLGWILLEAKTIAAPEPPGDPGPFWGAVRERIAVVPSWLFSQVVNLNLEVRTSVSIDSKTGAAKDGALFTYEAVPRGTLFYFELSENAYRALPSKEDQELNGRWDRPVQVAWDGLAMAEQLGLGGMGTRGFGRVRLMGARPTGSLE